MQSGTSWLWGNLRRHPQVFVPGVKELHYFSWHFHRSLRTYASQFQGGAGRVCGEISTEYLHLPEERIRFIRTVLPDVRLVVLLRNPIDRAWAHARQALMFRRGRRFGEVREQEFMRHFRSAPSRQGGDYLSGLDRWQGVFPVSQLYIGYYDDISRRPQKVLSEVFTHIGVSPEAAMGAPPREPQEAHAGGQSPASGDPQDVGVWSDALHAPIPPRLRDLLEDLYRPQIEALAARLGGPAARWRCAQTPGHGVGLPPPNPVDTLIPARGRK
jgi:hypothetical protein